MNDSQSLPSIDSMVIRAPAPTPMLFATSVMGAQTSETSMVGVQGQPEPNLNPIAESGAPRVCRATPVASASTPALVQTQAQPGPVMDQRPLVKENGKTHPFKPRTPVEIAAFAALWRDPMWTVPQIARRLRASERVIQNWRVQFGLPPRDQLLKLQAHGATVEGPASQRANAARAASAVTGGMAQAGQAPATQPPLVLGSAEDMSNPLADPEIEAAVIDLRSEASIMSPHSDLTPVQRKLTRLSVLLAIKAPISSWPSLQKAIEGLSRALLNARRIEAKIPPGAADPVILRREAAVQLCKEMKSVLNADEQAELARLIKLGADRLMARQPANAPRQDSATGANRP